jgi:primosomal protein N'
MYFPFAEVWWITEDKMSEALLKQQTEVLENKLSNLRTQVHSQGTSVKNLSLITIILKWSGTD